MDSSDKDQLLMKPNSEDSKDDNDQEAEVTLPIPLSPRRLIQPAAPRTTSVNGLVTSIMHDHVLYYPWCDLQSRPRESSLCFLASWLTVSSEQLPLAVRGHCLRHRGWSQGDQLFCCGQSGGTAFGRDHL